MSNTTSRTDRTADRNSAGLRAVSRAAEILGLTRSELARILALAPEALNRHEQAAETRSELALSQETAMRLSYMLGIWQALSTLFPTLSNRRVWLEAPNSGEAFRGAIPRTWLVEGSLESIKKLRQTLDGMTQ